MVVVVGESACRSDVRRWRDDGIWRSNVQLILNSYYIISLSLSLFLSDYLALCMSVCVCVLLGAGAIRMRRTAAQRMHQCMREVECSLIGCESICSVYHNAEASERRGGDAIEICDGV